MYDLIVIGAGSGGVSTARYIASKFNKRVALIENKRIGGTCVNVGCVPKKAMWCVASWLEDQHTMQKYGVTAQIEFDFKAMKQNRDALVLRLNGIYKNMVDNAKVSYFPGTASLLTRTQVQVDHDGTSQVLEGEKILIATGSWPVAPTVEGAEFISNSNHVFELEELPKRMLVVGGGYIGIEMAQIFNSFKVDTTLVVRSKVLRGSIDDDIREVWNFNAQRHGLKIVNGAELKKVAKLESGELHVQLTDGTELETDFVLYAAGREANLTGLNLAEVGVELDKHGFVAVDKFQQTSVDNIYALGDAISRPQLTPVAIKTGRTWAEHMYNNRPELSMDFDLISSVVFSHPPIGYIGLTADQAVAKFGKEHIKVYTSDFYNLIETLEEDRSKREKSYFKLICNTADSERVVGAQLIGRGADEILQTLATAMKMGATKKDIDSTVAIHPTASEEIVLMDVKIW